MESGQEAPSLKRIEPKPRRIWVEKYFPPQTVNEIMKLFYVERNSVSSRRAKTKEVIESALIEAGQKPDKNYRRLVILNEDLSSLFNQEQGPEKTIDFESAKPVAKLNEMLSLNLPHYRVSPKRRPS